ncbi:unnamed protein product, partial [Mycena citricolor]
ANLYVNSAPNTSAHPACARPPSSMNLRTIVQARPHTACISAAVVFSLFALTMSPSFVPLVGTLAVLLLYGPVLYHRPNTAGHVSLLCLFVTLASTVGRLVPALSALSDSGQSVAVLLVASGISSLLAISAVVANVRLSRAGWSQAMVFPAIWSSLWITLSHMPLGRLTSWSPVTGYSAYEWILPYTGAVGLDWIVAGWAVVVADAFGLWYMGGGPDPEEGELLESSRRPETDKQTSGSMLTLGLFLVALTVPSFLLPSYPTSTDVIESVTPFEVACALPVPQHRDGALTLDDYVDVSKSVNSRVKIVLWPESAVKFTSAAQRDDAFAYIRKHIGAAGTYWAVAYEETVTDPQNLHKTITHNALALLSNASMEPHLVYYKRNLVPIAESFHITAGVSPPDMYTLPLQKPNKVPNQQWGGRTRPLNITAAICMDFAAPSPFQDLPSRPSLILAPARTWDPAIGARMWEEVKLRANELGSVALWCDGGPGGVGGVAGHGFHDFYQAGPDGAWSRSLNIPFPFDGRRTLYSRFGDAIILAGSWCLVAGPAGLLAFRRKGGFFAAQQWIKGRFSRAPAEPDRLIEF